MRATRGFSLIELIMIIVVLGVASAFLTTTFTQLPRSLEVSEGAQTASQLAQQCSERVLAQRRDPAVGFDLIASGTCAGLPTLAGYAVNDVVTDVSGVAPCPSTLPNSCREVVVTVTRNGATVAVNNLLLVNF
jgi:prepilin-type N-terminal cleavage/methylation domain-containing protein